MPDGFDLELDIEGFRLWTEAAIKEVEGVAASKVLRALALKFISKVIEKSPVDFGRARAGWASFAVSLGRSPRLGVAGGSGTRRAGVGLDPSEEQAKGLAEGSFTSKLGRGSNQFVELVNGVPYIVLLEFGSSDQAPGGMMRITFKEMMAADVMTKEMGKELVKTYTKINRKLRRQRIGRVA